MHTFTQPFTSPTDLAAGEHSSICADTAPPCGSHVDTYKPTERDVWPAVRPVSPDTQMLPAPPRGTWLHQTHTAPSHGTAPHTGDQWSTPDELQHSQWVGQDRERWVLKMATHLREEWKIPSFVICASAVHKIFFPVVCVLTHNNGAYHSVQCSLKMSMLLLTVKTNFSV